MNTLNPETEDIPKTENKEDKLLDKALKLVNEEIKLEDLEPDEQLEFHKRFVVDEEEIPEPSDLNPESGKEELEKGLAPDTNTIPDKNQAFLQERKSRLDELNTINQKIESSNKRLGELGSIETTVHEKPKGDEIFSEKHAEKNEDRLQRLEANQKTVIDSETTVLKETRQKLEDMKVFTEISSFQFENPELKTSKPMETLNAGYKKFIQDVGGTGNVDKFLTNKEFRAQKESEGFVFPMSEVDFDKFAKISSAIKYKGEKKYPTLDSAYYGYQKENGILLDSVKQASLNATKQVLNQVASNADNTQTLSPEDGQVGNEGGGMTKAAMEKWLIDHPYPSGPKEEAMSKAIHNQVMGNLGG